MSDLTTLLTRMLDEMHYQGHGGFTVAMADTPTGQRIADVIEAAVAWAQEERPPKTAWADMTAGADLADAIDALLEDEG